VQGLSLLCVWVWFSIECSVVNILLIARWREGERGGWYSWNKLCSVVYLACMYGVQNTVLLSQHKIIYIWGTWQLSKILLLVLLRKQQKGRSWTEWSIYWPYPIVLKKPFKENTTSEFYFSHHHSLHVFGGLWLNRSVASMYTRKTVM
jgi:hypothetical protein